MSAALADAVLVVHAAFVLFVVGGLVATWIGLGLGMPFARNVWFRGIHLAAIGLPTAPPRDLKSNGGGLLALMGQDKKVRDGKVTFVLARGIGRAFLSRDVDETQVIALLDRSLAA